MSDLSSSSDDDSMLNSPTFVLPAKQSRASLNREKNKMSFLDSCLQSEQLRVDRKERMADLMKVEQEDDEMEEESLVPSNNKETTTTTAANNGDNSMMDVETTTTILPTASTIPTDKDDREQVKDNHHSSKEKKNQIQMKKVKVEETKDSNNHKNDFGLSIAEECAKVPKRDLNDPNYWSQIESYAKDAKENLHEREQRRRNIHDAVEGIDFLITESQNSFLDDEYFVHSDDDDNNDCDEDDEDEDEEEDYKDQNHQTNNIKQGGDYEIKNKMMKKTSNHGREKMIALADAKMTGKSSLTGVRKVLFGTKKRNINQVNTPFSLIDSSELAIKEIKSLLNNTLDKPVPKQNNMNETAKQQWILLRTKIYKPMKEAIKIDYLVEFLYGNRFERHINNIKKEEGNCTSIYFQDKFLLWLLRISMSGHCVGKSLSDASFTLLQKLLRLNVKPLSLGKSATSFLLCGSDMLYILENEFGLYTKKGPIPNEDDGNLDNETKQSNLDIDRFGGLYHSLELWTQLIENDLVDWGDSSMSCVDNNSSNEKGFENGSPAMIIAFLTRLGLDPTLHSEGFIPSLNKMVDILLSVIFKQSNLKGGDYELINQSMTSGLIHCTSQLTISLCQNLGGGDKKSADNDDTHGYLPLSLSARLWQSHENLSLLYTIFGAAYAKDALICCFEGDEKSIEDQVDKKLNDICTQLLAGNVTDKSISVQEKEKFPPQWYVLLFAEMALGTVVKSGDTIINDGPRFLAIVEIVTSCLFLGLNFYGKITDIKNKKQTHQKSGGIYGSVIDAEIVCSFLERMEGLCHTLKHKVISVFVFPHLRRAKESLTYLSVYCHHMKLEANKLSQNTHHGRFSLGDSQQKSIKNFLSMSPNDAKKGSMMETPKTPS